MLARNRLLASIVRYYNPLPCIKEAIALLEAGDADAAREAAECVEDDAGDLHQCEAFILMGFAWLLYGAPNFAGTSVSLAGIIGRAPLKRRAGWLMENGPLQLKDALEYWAIMPRVSPKAPWPYSRSDIESMATILCDKNVDKQTRLDRAAALLPQRFRIRAAASTGELFVLCRRVAQVSDSTLVDCGRSGIEVVPPPPSSDVPPQGHTMAR